MSIELTSLANTQEPAVVVFIDCQRDFVDREGKLYIPGAEKTITGLQKLLDDIKPNPKILKLFTYDTHDEDYASSEEASQFPPHCIIGTSGHELVLDTANCTNDYHLRKGVFDMWAQNPLVTGGIHNPTYSHDIETCSEGLRQLWFQDHQEPLVHIVGHALNFCVKYAVDGFIQRGFNVRLFNDLSTGIAIDDSGKGTDANDVFHEYVKSGKMTIAKLF